MQSKNGDMSRLLLRVVFESLIVAAVFGIEIQGVPLMKRSLTSSERNLDEYPDYQLGVRYDEYPMIVPKKRTALLVDRLMLALQKAIDEDLAPAEVNKIEGPPLTQTYSLSPDEVRKMDLQRRGHGSLSEPQKGRIYWRCYFNAVTCF